MQRLGEDEYNDPNTSEDKKALMKKFSKKSIATLPQLNEIIKMWFKR